MKKKLLKNSLTFTIGILIMAGNIFGQRQMENLDRGLVAVKVTDGVFLSWRMLGTEWSGEGYNLYRGSTRINSSPITGATNYTDASGTTGSTYYIKAIVNGSEQTASKTVVVWSDFYKTINLQVPAGITTPDGVTCTYSPNDCSVGDLNGDGEYEIIVKWDPSNSKDNSLSGYTGNVYLDAYTLSGTRMWRIDLGINIRAGAHYTQFMVYDLDGDGKAEIACKTAPGTKDGTGNYLSGAAAGTNNSADYRNSSGYILSGPEYLTLFNGQTGKELQTINYEVARGTVSSWGDSYGNRVDRFLACIAYLDGKTPSLVMCRGYYTRAYLVAYKWNGTSITKQWSFDSNTSGNSSYAGQGNHNLSVADVDDDGFDEIIYGACCIDHNGTGKWSTGLGHGDAMHVTDIDPGRTGLEVWGIHEGTGTPGSALLDAKTGAIIWKTANADVGRGVAADLTTDAGVEVWGGTTGLRTCTNASAGSTPSSSNFAIWWNGDDSRELLDGTKLDSYTLGRQVTLYNYATATACNGTKNTPNLQADSIGDFREEVILHSSDNTKLIIFTTTSPTSRKIYTPMHDKVYRLGIAWQNVAYNQPPHLSFFFGNNMGTPPTPNITLVGGTNICLPTTIIPYVSVNDGTWQNVSSISVNSGDKVEIGPQPTSGGSWSWTGLGTSGTSREQTIYPTSSGVVTATYTNSCGAISTQTFTITINSTTVPVTGITIAPTSASVNVGSTTILTATVAPTNATNKSVTWSSGNTAIATVSTAGVVTGVAAGSATIIVATVSGGFTASSVITVTSTGTPCINPVAITIPFTQNGVGDFCFVTSQAMAYINSWNMSLVEINGVDFTNVWSNNMPASIDGKWYIHYVGPYSWSHFEAPALKGADEISEPIGELKVYSNPFTSDFNIDLNGIEGVSRIEIVNSVGQVLQVVDKNNIDGNLVHFSLNATDLYFIVRITTWDSMVIKKIVRE